MNLEEELKKKEKLQELIYYHYDMLEKFKKEKKLLLEHIFDLCLTNGGHDFRKESNGDYHRPGYYYICNRCEYLSHFNN